MHGDAAGVVEADVAGPAATDEQIAAAFDNRTRTLEMLCERGYCGGRAGKPLLARMIARAISPVFASYGYLPLLLGTMHKGIEIHT